MSDKNDTKDQNERIQKKRLWEDDAEYLQDYYDSLPDDLRVRTPKPKGYHAPDMDFPKKGRKPRNRKQKWQKGKQKNAK